VVGDIEVGTVLPALRVPLTTRLIVAAALATGDFTDVHHDAEAARAKGMPDIFMNILTTTGLVQRYVTDWAGPGALVRGIAVRLGAPNYPGDTMTLTGAVTGSVDEGGEAVVAVSVRGANSLGDHVTGEVRIVLARAARPGGAR
jgi:acyl dehydratase